MREASARRRRAAIVGVAGVVWIGLVTWASTLSAAAFSIVARSPLDAALVLAASVGALAVGAIEWGRNPASPWGAALAFAGAAWPLSAGANPGSNSALIFTFCLTLPFVSAPLIAQVAAGSLHGARSMRVTTALVLAIWLGAVVLAGIVPAMLFQPAAEGCPNCPSNLIGVTSLPTVARDVRAIGLVITAVGSLAVVFWLGWRFFRATSPARAAALPMLAPALAVLLAAAINAMLALQRHEAWPEVVVWRFCAVALIATALGGVASWWRIVVTRHRIAGLAVEVADSPRPGGVRSLLAEQLRDPGLVVAYQMDDGRSVDADGRSVDVSEGLDRQVSTITRDDLVIARLEHRRSVSDDPARLAEVVRASRLALENERLQAASRARLAELRASRALVVETGDAARQRLERDLHDGAQQRLVSLALALQLCRSALGQVDAARLRALDTADRELRAAIDALRAVAHGLYPAVLAEEGLAAGVEALRESSTVPIRVSAMPDERLPGPVEAAAWFAIEEAVYGLDGGSVALSVQRLQDRLVVEMDRDGSFAPELIDVEDRIGALD